MAAERLPMRKLREVSRLRLQAGQPGRAIARALSLSPSTINKYLGRIALAKLSWPLPAELDDDAALERLLFTGRLRTARFRQDACVEDIDYQHPRGLQKAAMLRSFTEGCCSHHRQAQALRPGNRLTAKHAGHRPASSRRPAIAVAAILSPRFREIVSTHAMIAAPHAPLTAQITHRVAAESDERSGLNAEVAARRQIIQPIRSGIATGDLE